MVSLPSYNAWKTKPIIFSKYTCTTRTYHSNQYTGLHRHNNAERSIQTFRKYFIAIFSSTPPHFPLNLWDKLFKQVIITLNLLWPSRVKIKLSAYAHMYGAFDYQYILMAPPRAKFLSRIVPANIKS